MAQYSVSEARARLNEVIQLARSEAVEILKHGKAAVTIVDSVKYEELVDYVEELEDRLAVLESKADPDWKTWEEVKEELGWEKPTR